VTIKSGTEDSVRPKDKAVCENIIVSNCTMAHGHGGVVCGSEISGDVRNVVISNCVFRGTERGLRFKARRGRGGVIENVRVCNVIMEDVPAPFVMNLFYACGARGEAKITDMNPYPVDEWTPQMRRLRFSHISVRNAEYAACLIHGLPEMPIQDIAFHDVDIHMKPDAGKGTPGIAEAIEKMSKRGFYCRYAQGVRLESVRVDGLEGPLVDEENCEDIVVQNG
jgi:polygalacturonase